MAESGLDNLVDPVETRGDHSKFESEGHSKENQQSSGSFGRPSRGQALKREVLETSQSIFRAFLPSQGSSSYPDYYHPLCERFWGSLDDIFRIYDSPSKAAKHLHDVHFDCTAAKHSDRLHDDPCSVWIREATPEPDRDAAILREAQDFVQYLSSVSEMLSEIQWLVASSVKGAKGHTSRPRLPSSLVHAFETLLSYYVCTAKQLSLVNRTGSSTNKTSQKTRDLVLRLDVATKRLRDVGSDAVALLDSAQKDILLEGTTDQFEDTLGLQAVGAEFLIAALLTTAQNRNINLPGESGAQTNTGSSNMEVVEMYKRYTNQIQFEANRRPQKRVFIVIHELQEELGALRKIFSRQDSLLYWYMNEITPHSSDIACDVRRTPFLFEEKYIEDQRYILNQRESEIDRIRNTAAALELHVGRMIEILEEDHGKAIRVFTVVTLFFLPL
ncbi:hypothetical protein F5883DRAFT_412396 [Diaporthe sp. PMI_573]|nr:hypothetical protein F5883DRAFT_412396 [Diaporthaceae sp. PMI_573]